MSNLVTEVDTSEEEKSKKKSRTRVRVLLIVVNSLLGFYFVFFTGQTIYQKLTDKNSDMVTLCDLSASKSTSLYSKLFTETYDINDYCIYGNSLNLSTNKIDALNYEPLNDLRLIPVQKDVNNITAKVVQPSTVNLNEGLDLANLELGDYILTKDSKALKVLSGTEKHENTIYTLPKSNGRRNKITVYSYPKNPCFVINVTEVKKLPDNYYDMVLVATSDTYSSISSAFDKYEVKVVEPTESLATIDSYNTSYVFKLDLTNSVTTNQVTCSSYISSTFLSSKIDSGFGAGYDSNYFVRELGGRYLGGNLKNSNLDHSSDLASTRDEYSNGKMAFVIEAPTSDAEGLHTSATDVISFINNRRSIV